jgi:hypothetical protein
MAGRTPIWSRSLAISAALLVAVVIMAVMVITHRSQVTTRATLEPALTLQRSTRLPDQPRRRFANAAAYERVIPPQQHWYTENVERTGCIESDGPLPMLETLRESGPLVSVHWNDWRTVEKVKVEVAEDALRARRIEFYPTRLACEDAAVSNRRVRDPYHG